MPWKDKSKYKTERYKAFQANEDDTICALVMLLACGTQYEAKVYHIIEKYYRSDKSFE